MSEKETTKAPKAVKPRLAKGHSLELRDFPYAITNEMLQGPNSAKLIKHIQNWEAENDVKVLGRMIVMD